uniref:FAD dependent oxidoreductase domain-containing protein n=1 Tax=Strigamia maritima TaxID=126957 RepID=T1JNT4_STRMM
MDGADMTTSGQDRISLIKFTMSSKELAINVKLSSKPRIGILGGGVIGVTCADKISQELHNIHVTLISDKFSPHTTGDVAAGLWCEYLTGSDQCQEKLYKWLKESFEAIEQLYFGQDAALAGVTQLSGYRIDNKPYEPLFWQNIVHGFRHLTEEELLVYGDNYKGGLNFTSYTAECPKMLPYLMSKFANRGGKTFKYKAENLHQLIGHFDVLINCTGINASQVVPDPSVIPIRGQVMKVKAPWVKHFVLDDYKGNYLIPNIDSVILGGTSNYGNYNLTAESKDAHKIWQGCCQLLPSIKSSKVLSHHVGLRPGRHCVRLERETLYKSTSDKME